MKITLTIITIFICILGLNSCKKEQDSNDTPIHLVMDGYVRETQTGKAIPFARIRMLEYASGNIGGIGGYSLLGEAYTDTSGYYKMEGDTRKGKTIFFEAEKTEYRFFPKKNIIANSNYIKEDVNLDIPGYVKVFIENTSPQDSVTLVVWIEDSQAKSRKGLIGGIEDVFETSAKVNGKIFFNVIKNGVTTNYIDSIDIPYRDTSYYHGTF